MIIGQVTFNTMANKNNKLKILGICGEANAVSWYRMINPIGEYGGDLIFKLGRHNDGEGEENVVSIGNARKNLKELQDDWFTAYDVVFIKYVARKEDAQNVLYWKSKSPNTKLILDVDDNVFAIPDGNFVKDTWGEGAQAILAYVAQEADAVSCSTQPLADIFKELNSNVFVVPNKIKPNQWKPLKKGKTIKIGWTYSPTHAPDKEIIHNALQRIKDKYPQVVIETTGSGIPFTKDIDGVPFLLYPKWLCAKAWDIAIAPLQANDFNECKSNIKWLESTMAGSVFVGSNVYPYANSIEHGKTGFLASTEEEWVEILSTLIEDKKLRQETVKNAKKVVLANHNIDKDNPIKILETGVLGTTK